jgi:hypothetical protein
VVIGQYILDEDGNPRREKNFLKWALWLGNHDRKVKKDFICVDGEAVEVSTIYLGLDQRNPFNHPSKPLLWETMIFGGERGGYCDRYASRADALAGHAVALALAKGETLEKLAELKDTRR